MICFWRHWLDRRRLVRKHNAAACSKRLENPKPDAVAAPRERRLVQGRLGLNFRFVGNSLNAATQARSEAAHYGIRGFIGNSRENDPVRPGPHCGVAAPDHLRVSVRPHYPWAVDDG